METVVKYHVEALQYQNIIDFFEENLQTIWESRGGTDPIKDILDKKYAECKPYGIKGFVLYKQAHPCGFAWVDTKTPHYGNIMLHTFHAEDEAPLIEAVLKKDYFTDVLLELVQFKEKTSFRQHMLEKNIAEIVRLRMGMYLPEAYDYPSHQNEIAFIPLTKEHYPQSAHLSYIGHQVSNDYLLYPELSDPHKRKHLEKLVFDEIYGPVIQQSSYMMTWMGIPMGACLLIEVPCWGFDKVPWIFDIALDPNYHGQGYGKLLMQQVLA